MLFVGRAQEKVRTFRTEKRRNPETGQSYPWIVNATAVVNQDYVYGLDADFGPFFLTFSSYFPCNGRLCVKGNEWAERQAAKTGIGFTALDNGFASCADPVHLQKICDRLSPARIDALLRNWLRVLPHLSPGRPGSGRRGGCAAGAGLGLLDQMLHRVDVVASGGEEVNAVVDPPGVPGFEVGEAGLAGASRVGEKARGGQPPEQVYPPSELLVHMGAS